MASQARPWAGAIGGTGAQQRPWFIPGGRALATVIFLIVWELVNPVSMLHRGLIFGFGFAWLLIAGIFLFDLLVAARGWCGHVCPVGAFYSVLGRFALLRVAAPRQLDAIRSEGIDVRLMFLEAKVDTLVKRFSETRRRHPLSQDRLTVTESITLEREMLGRMGDLGHRIDTSELNANALRNWVKQFVDLAGGEMKYVAAKMPEMTPDAAWSRSQSSNTMFGDLPPSSSDTRFIVCAAWA